MAYKPGIAATFASPIFCCSNRPRKRSSSIARLLYGVQRAIVDNCLLTSSLDYAPPRHTSTKPAPKTFTMTPRATKQDKAVIAAIHGSRAPRRTVSTASPNSQGRRGPFGQHARGLKTVERPGILTLSVRPPKISKRNQRAGAWTAETRPVAMKVSLHLGFA